MALNANSYKMVEAIGLPYTDFKFVSVPIKNV